MSLSLPQINHLLQDEDSEGSREERAFVMWINSLNIGTYITNLTSDMKDGLVVLQVMHQNKHYNILMQSLT